jgi:hypothetical protein
LLRRNNPSALCIVLSLAGGCSLLVDADTNKLGRSLTRNEGTSVSGNNDASVEEDAAVPAASACESCDDHVSCTVDSCAGESCGHKPDNTLCQGERCSVVKDCIPLRCRDDSDCDDGDLCSGTETCAPDKPGADALTGCVAGQALACDDRVACTEDVCVPHIGCASTPNNQRCNDGVDCTIDVCSPQTGCRSDPSDVRCDFCQPGSQCDAAKGCVGGFANDCSDGDSCTADQCDPEAATCRHFGSCDVGPDTCETPESIALQNGHGVVGGSFAHLTSTYETRCGKERGRDAVYHVVIDALSDVVLDSTLGSARTALAVGTSCSAAGFDLACAGSLSDAERGSRLLVHRYDPMVSGRDLFILVDAFDADENGDYVLSVDITPAAADSCAGNLSVGAGGTLLGFIDTRVPPNLWGTERGSCQPAAELGTAPEAIVAISGAADGTVTLEASSAAFSPALYVRNRCEDKGNTAELGCTITALDGSPNTVQLDVPLAAGSQGFAIVDGGKDGAPYTLRVLP